MRIGEAAGRAGVTAKTIRFWEDQHLLPPAARTAAGAPPTVRGPVTGKPGGPVRGSAVGA